MMPRTDNNGKDARNAIVKNARAVLFFQHSCAMAEKLLGRFDIGPTDSWRSPLACWEILVSPEGRKWTTHLRAAFGRTNF